MAGKLLLMSALIVAISLFPSALLAKETPAKAFFSCSGRDSFSGEFTLSPITSLSSQEKSDYRFGWIASPGENGRLEYVLWVVTRKAVTTSQVHGVCLAAVAIRENNNSEGGFSTHVVGNPIPCHDLLVREDGKLFFGGVPERESTVIDECEISFSFYEDQNEN